MFYDAEPRIRPATRENILSPMAYVKAPSLSNPSLAIPTRRAAGDASPVMENTNPAYKRGSLYLFDPQGPQGQEAKTPRTIQRRYHNDETTDSREWQSSGIRRVGPAEHPEKKHGVRILTDSRNHNQQVHVVGEVLPQEDATRHGIRCSYEGRTTGETTIKKILDRDGALGTPEPATPVGAEALRKKPASNFSVNNIEKLVVCVSDIVQRRNGGATNLFVSLSRDLVAPPAVSQERPSTAPVLFLEPPKRALTLQRCHEQLTTMTGIPTQMKQLASVFWDMDGLDDVDASALASLEVSFQVFSTAFTAAPSSQRLAKHKI